MFDISINMVNGFVITIPSYNNRAWCVKSLLSALDQDYPNFRIVYSDDCSDDGTVDEIEKIISQHIKGNLVTLVKNTERLYAVHNIYNMVHSCNDDEIIVVLDGDDWLFNNNVLKRLDQEYQKDIWMTYGQYISYHDREIGCSCAIPNDIIEANVFRRYRWCTSHLRTFYAWLYKKINYQDLMYNGKWLQMAGDLAIMFPMLEMSGKRQAFISDVLYEYNYTSPINDGKVNRQLQIDMERRIRSMSTYYRIAGKI